MASASAACLAFEQRFKPLHELSPLNDASLARLFVAQDTRDGSVVAVKEIHKARLFEANPDRVAKIRERLTYEVEAHREVSRQGPLGVCLMKESVETPSVVYIVMELCKGLQLFDVVTQAPGGYLSEAVAGSLFEQIVLGCRSIHNAGYIHRDLKPENILCFGDAGAYQTKIVDFGAAKPLSQNLMASISGTTVWNASPERGYGEAESCSADVWALGCILYFMLVGNSPFHNLRDGEANDAVVIDRVIDDAVSWPAIPHVSKQAQALVEWLLQKEANDRPELEEVLASEWLTNQKIEHSGPAVLGSTPTSSDELDDIRQRVNRAVESGRH